MVAKTGGPSRQVEDVSPLLGSQLGVQISSFLACPAVRLYLPALQQFVRSYPQNAQPGTRPGVPVLYVVDVESFGGRGSTPAPDLIGQGPQHFQNQEGSLPGVPLPTTEDPPVTRTWSPTWMVRGRVPLSYLRFCEAWASVRLCVVRLRASSRPASSRRAQIC